MDLSQLKNTSDEQFSKDVTFDLLIPDGGSDHLQLTIKSVRNPAVKTQFTKLVNSVTKETAKLDKPNVTDAQAEVVNTKVAELETAICKLIFVKFSGLTDGDKPLASTDANKEMLVSNYEWIRKAIVEKATSSEAFYTA